jgi:predicted transcriptional regulator
MPYFQSSARCSILLPDVVKTKKLARQNKKDKDQVLQKIITSLPHSSLTIGEIMSEKLETIRMREMAQEAAMKMTKKNVSSLSVVHEDGRPAGIVTE